MYRSAISLLFLLPALASAQVNDSLPDRTVQPVLRRSLLPEIAGNTQLSWRELADLPALDQLIHGNDNKINTQFLEGQVVIVTERCAPVDDEPIDPAHVAQIRVVAGATFRDKDTANVLYVGCRSEDCRHHRAIERTEDEDGNYTYQWRGPEFSIAAEALDGVVHGQKLEAGMRVYVNRLHKLVYFGESPVRHQEIYRYLNLAGALDRNHVPSPREALRAKPTQRLDQATWVEVRGNKYSRLTSPFFP